jgi:hypothetical protein
MCVFDIGRVCKYVNTSWHQMCCVPLVTGQ